MRPGPQFWRFASGGEIRIPTPDGGRDRAMTAKAKSQGEIRVGVGGGTFEPWRGVFYPKGLPQKRELEYASRQLTTIEINGTYYGSQKPESFSKGRGGQPGN